MVEEDDTCHSDSTQETQDYSEEDEYDFLQGLPKEQQDIVREKLSSCQNQFRVFNDNQKQQKVNDVLRRITDIDEPAAQLAIESCRNNELLAIKRLLEDESFKQTVVAMSHGEIKMNLESIMYIDKRQELRDILLNDSDDDGAINDDPDDPDNWYERPVYHYDTGVFFTRRRTKSGESHSERKMPRLCLDDALIILAGLHEKESEDDDKEMKPSVSEEPETATEKKPNHTPKKQQRSKVVTKVVSCESEGSDFADREERKTANRSTIEKEADFFRAVSGSASRTIPAETLRQMGWSEARIKAFRNRERNPNQYYYRFNDPGEPQATGKWSPKDKALFLKLIKERGVDYQWGIFSKQIPGRVGYQCSNFYRQLIKDGEIKDDNYTFDKDGKLVFRFRDKRGRSTLTRHPSKRRQDDLEDYDDIPSNNDLYVEENVLPDYIDPMTMMPVVKPAISPYGHVMGYDSWVKLLNRNPKNTCPFTKKKLTRRSLVKLNSDNIDQYRDKIINANGFDIDFHCD